MSVTLTITGKYSVLETNFIPPLILDGAYECGLLYFSSFNSIPNISDHNNLFVYGEHKQKIKVPTGIYDLQDLYEYLNDRIKNKCELIIKPNNNTMSCFLFCSEVVDFGVENSIGSLLGFPKVKLEANKWHESTTPITILPVSVIRIECDLIQGSYTNGIPSHIIYEFVPNIPPSHRFVEIPNNVIYFPITQNIISSVTVKVVDLDGKRINFRGENIQLCLHLRKIK